MNPSQACFEDGGRNRSVWHVTVGFHKSWFPSHPQLMNWWNLVGESGTVSEGVCVLLELVFETCPPWGCSHTAGPAGHIALHTPESAGAWCTVLPLLHPGTLPPPHFLGKAAVDPSLCPSLAADSLVSPGQIRKQHSGALPRDGGEGRRWKHGRRYSLMALGLSVFTKDSKRKTRRSGQ